MSDEIRVHVVTRKGKNFYLRYTDPVTGKRIEKNSGTTSKRKALRAAGEWQAELNQGMDDRGKVTYWAEFRRRYESDHTFNLRKRSLDDISTVFNVIEKTMKPDRINRITPQWITRFVNIRLEQGRSPSTVEGDLRQLKAALNWAKVQGFISTVPNFPKLKKARRAKQMKGRPITAEEFERMLAAVEKMPKRQHESIRYLLRGLWLSGLRIGEALSLTWDAWADGIRVDTSGEFTVLLISAEDEKGGKDREYPITPDFEDFLLATAADERKGFVFNPVLYRGPSRRVDTVSKAISRVGELAGVKVDEKPAKKGNGKVPVYASAHDCRRAFGHRWARKVMPMVLKELMRHESVTTTEKFYVGIQAQETARHLRETESHLKKVNGEVNGMKKGSQSDD